MKKFNCIMLIDDDDTCSYIADKIITKLELSEQTLNMKNGRDAIEFLAEKCGKDTIKKVGFPDLIFLDLNMPVMDGLEFLEEFYGTRFSDKCVNTTDVYVLTSSDNQKDMDKVNKFNIKGYISKPMTVEKLYNITASA